MLGGGASLGIMKPVLGEEGCIGGNGVYIGMMEI